MTNSLLPATPIAYALKNDSFVQYGESFPNPLRDTDSVKALAVEINDGIAFHAYEMMMWFGVGVKPSGLTISLHHGDHSDLRERQKRSIHRVERDAGEYLPDLLKDCERAGMIVGFDQLFIYGRSLRCYLQTVLPASVLEESHHCTVIRSTHLYLLRHRNCSYLTFNSSTQLLTIRYLATTGEIEEHLDAKAGIKNRIEHLHVVSSFGLHKGRSKMKRFRYADLALLILILISLLSSVDLAAQPVQITTDPAADYHAKWSLDGTKIIFTSQRGGKTGLWLITPEGDSLTPVETGLSGDHHVSWSPDGNRIVFDAYGPGGPPLSLWIMALEDGRPHRVTQYRGPEFHPSWSPNDSLIAFASFRSGNTDIWVIPVVGGEPTQITTDSPTDYHPLWSPDGSRLAITSDRSGNKDIWIISLKDGKARQLTKHKGRDDHACWSPDGSMIAFTSDRSGKDDIWIVPAEGGKPRRLTSEYDNGWPSWSPDGRKIVFSSRRDGNSDLWIIELKPEADDSLGPHPTADP